MSMANSLGVRVPFLDKHMIEKAWTIEPDFYNGKHDAAWGVWHIYAWQKWALSQGLIKDK